MKPRFSLVLLLCALFMGFATSLAAGTEANTSIINQASATYTDSLNAPQSTTSNSVTTIVQQVYSFTITPNGETPAAPGQTETALPGAPVYFNYTVTNTGNGDDTITLANVQDAADAFNLNNVTIYLDTGCDGSVAGDSPVTSLALGADASACLIVSGVIPTGTADGAQANYNLEGTSAGAAAQDPAVVLEDTNNWARAEANTGANLTATKEANPSSAVAAGGSISYTIEGSNNGGAAAYGIDLSDYNGLTGEGIIITDNLDDNLTYTAGTLTGTAGAGAVSFAYSIDDGTSWVQTEPTDATTVTDVAMIISAPTANTAFFSQSTNYTMSFSATAAADAAANTTITNQAVVNYSVDADATTSDTTTSNATNTTVAATSAVAIGPEGLATANPISGTASYTDSNGNTWNVTLSGGFENSDTQTLTSDVSTGDTVAFAMSVANTGNVTDIFDVEALSATGYNVRVFNANGTTPLNGSLSIAAGATQDIIVKVTIPAGANVGDTITVTATSTNDTTQSDTTFAVIPTPDVGYAVDIAQLGASNDTPTPGEANDTLGAQSANPGGIISFPIEVTNTGVQTDTFDLSADLPTGWNVEFVVDADCNGIADTTGTTVTDTGSLAAGARACYVAQVSVPVSAPPSIDNPVSFTATSNGDATVSNTVSGTATVATTDALSFINDQSATTAANSVVTYTHTVINSGNAATTVSIAAQADTTRFTYQYAVDTDGDGSADGETFYPELSVANGQAFSVNANDTRTVFVQVIVPGTASEGDVETVTITATGNYGGGSIATDDVQDTTRVLDRELELVKSAQTCTALNAASTACTAASITDANGLTAEPNDYIQYTIVAENLGSANISNVKVIDPLPAATSYVSASATTSLTGNILYSTDGTTWSDTAPAAGTLLAGSSIYVAVDSDTDGNITDADIMIPGADLVLTFLVQVQ